ncbi:hypothetical protein DRW03_25945 [Corallococcus sp. H22C18031201]|nr:hypothetical protein DRW03_25945 [Corallococcus sp. H22C18031201]
MKKHLLLLPLLLAVSGCFSRSIEPDRILPKDIPAGMVVTVVASSPQNPDLYVGYVVDANTAAVLLQRESSSLDELAVWLRRSTGNTPRLQAQAQAQHTASGASAPSAVATCIDAAGKPCSLIANAGDVPGKGGGPGPTGTEWRRYIYQLSRFIISNNLPYKTLEQVTHVAK